MMKSNSNLTNPNLNVYHRGAIFEPINDGTFSIKVKGFHISYGKSIAECERIISEVYGVGNHKIS